MSIDLTRFVSLVKSQLLVDRQARDHVAGDAPGDETHGRILEVAALEIRLTPGAIRPELHGMEIDPSRATRGQLDASGTPLGLDLVPEFCECRESLGLAGSVDREIHVAMLARLPAGERVDSPTAGHPRPAWHSRQPGQHRENLIGMHKPIVMLLGDRALLFVVADRSTSRPT
jgi:hypothetical protein